MSAFVQELKHAVSTEIGVRVEDSYESTKRELSVHEGRQSAFLDGAKAAEALLQSVDKDLEEGKFDLATAAHVKRYVSRCANALGNLSVQSANICIAYTGRIHALGQTLTLIKSIADDAKAKAATLHQAESLPPPESVRGRIEGMPPAPTIKEQRLAEAALEQEVVESEVPADAPEPVKRRKRKLDGQNT